MFVFSVIWCIILTLKGKKLKNSKGYMYMLIEMTQKGF